MGKGRMSESQKEKVRLYNKQRAATRRLEQKVGLDKKREKLKKGKSHWQAKTR